MGTQGLPQLRCLQRPGRSGHRAGLAPHHRDPGPHRREQLQQAGRDTATAEDRDRLVIQAVTGLGAPVAECLSQGEVDQCRLGEFGSVAESSPLGVELPRQLGDRRGHHVDGTADRVVEACVIVGIAWRDPALYLPALVLVATWYVNITVFLAVGAALEGPGAKLIEYPPGILERTEAIIFFIVLGLLESTQILRLVAPLLCYAMAALEIVTGAQRLLFGLRRLRPQ